MVMQNRKVNNKYSDRGFTLAEMMIVLLILAIMLAAFAPMMTRRMKSSGGSGGESLWSELTANGPGIYYGENVVIGANSKADDDNARLILKKGAAAQNHMLFKNQSGTANAGLYIDNTNMYFGSVPANKMSYNTSFGLGALANLGTSGGYNTAIGNTAGYSNTTGNNNVFIGHAAGYPNTTGHHNVFLGNYAGYSNTSGSNNAFIGTVAGYSNTTGSYNTFTGNYAGRSNTGGNNNTGLGYYALYNNTKGGQNTGVGHYALYNNTEGGNNTALGRNALYNNIAGGANVGLGDNALYNTAGSYNTGVGYNACYNVTSGSYKTCIGIGAGPTSIEDDKTSDANQVWIGVSNSTVYIPGSLYVGGTQVTSDKRLKNIKSENTSGLEKIKQIKVFNYTLKDDKAKTPRVGVIAQDLQKIFPDAVSKGSGGFLAVRTEDILYALVNAVKELDKKINDVIASVKNDVAGVRNDIATLKKENKELKEQNKMLKQVQDDMARVQNDILKQNKALEAKLLKLENKK